MIFLDTAQVAERLGLRDAGAFLRIRDRLETVQDFPPPFPTLHRPLRWRADAVQAWIEAQGLPEPLPFTPAPGSNVVLMKEARKA
ncbi:MAG: hypothetical protein KBT70_18560 [Roseovarius sp.]|uniref:helix-turn-helix transcriptional regulator n=1 Tax=Roseovarius sp. TaxID=1486281 RepID=UPI001B65D599|nr:hypothetical protein [Roseovarius sp.]MBQ0752201.1 hypothetical protein [Roseovarius sp.]MBQ0812095.1 hypothetical protein [Roseovarius sp.]